MVVVVLVIFYLMAGFMTAGMTKVMSEKNPPYDSLHPDQMAFVTLFWPLWVACTPFFFLTWLYSKIY